jgi:hypothetical protein
MLHPVNPDPPRLARLSLPAPARFLPAFALALALLCGCGGAARPPASTAVADIPAPYPFTVYELRAGCPLGRVIEYRIEREGSPARVERWVFAPLDPDTVSVTTTAFDADGKPDGAPTTESAKWTELHEHARFPQSATQIYNESLTLPAGTFDVMRYVVRKRDKRDESDEPGKRSKPDDGESEQSSARSTLEDGKGSQVSTYWFARNLPGPPVKVEIVKDGHPVMTMTMQANRTH